MNIPGFTAEASLYKTSGHYQTGKDATRFSSRMISAIHLAMMMDETVNVFGCAPGSTMVGEGGDWYCFPDPLTEPSWGIGGGGGMPTYDPGEPYKGGGPGKPRPKRPPKSPKLPFRQCTKTEVLDLPGADLRCATRADVAKKRVTWIRCTAGGEVMCCVTDMNGANADCVPLSDVSEGSVAK